MTRPSQFSRIEGIALDKLEFPANDLIQRPNITRNINAFDEDAWPFLNLEGDIQLMGLSIPLDPGADVDKGVSEFPHACDDFINRLVDVADVIPFTRFDFESPGNILSLEVT